jgi:hypothetical protein
MSAASPQCIGPEIRTATTAVAASNTSASSNGINWPTGLVWAGLARLAWVRSAVTGIVIVVIAFISSVSNNCTHRLPHYRRYRFDRDQMLR